MLLNESSGDILSSASSIQFVYTCILFIDRSRLQCHLKNIHFIFFPPDFFANFLLSTSSSSLSGSSSTGSALPSFCANALLFALQPLEHVVTSSQHLSHFFLHVNGRLQVTHIFEGRFSFFTPCVIEREISNDGESGAPKKEECKANLCCLKEAQRRIDEESVTRRIHSRSIKSRRLVRFY